MASIIIGLFLIVGFAFLWLSYSRDKSRKHNDSENTTRLPRKDKKLSPASINQKLMNHLDQNIISNYGLNEHSLKLLHTLLLSETPLADAMSDLWKEKCESWLKYNAMIDAQDRQCRILESDKCGPIFPLIRAQKQAFEDTVFFRRKWLHNSAFDNEPGNLKLHNEFCSVLKTYSNQNLFNIGTSSENNHLTDYTKSFDSELRPEVVFCDKTVFNEKTKYIPENFSDKKLIELQKIIGQFFDIVAKVESQMDEADRLKLICAFCYKIESVQKGRQAITSLREKSG